MPQTLDLIMPSYKAAVETALQQSFATTAITDIVPLAGGLSASPVYKIIVDHRPYVLKLDPVTGPSTMTSSANLKLAADAGIAPPLHYQDRTSGVSINGFIDNQPIRSAFTPDDLITRLSHTIKAIHNIPFPTDGHDLRKTVDDFIARFRQSRMLNNAAIDECLSYYDMVRSAYPWHDTDKVFSHNDLNPNNILCDGKRIWIIDWDTAFPNDRYVDLACAANFFVHTEQGEKLFLDTYFDTVDDYKRARFFIMRQVCRIIYAMLMFHLAAQAKPADYPHNQDMEGITLAEVGPMIGAGKISLASYEGQFLFGKAMLNAALQHMRSPRFAVSISILSSTAL